MNIHRWRKLEGSDPSTYEMIQKIQTLQKRLIAKTEEVKYFRGDNMAVSALVS